MPWLTLYACILIVCWRAFGANFLWRKLSHKLELSCRKWICRFLLDRRSKALATDELRWWSGEGAGLAISERDREKARFDWNGMEVSWVWVEQCKFDGAPGDKLGDEPHETEANKQTCKWAPAGHKCAKVHKCKSIPHNWQASGKLAAVATADKSNSKRVTEGQGLGHYACCVSEFVCLCFCVVVCECV